MFWFVNDENKAKMWIFPEICENVMLTVAKIKDAVFLFET